MDINEITKSDIAENTKYKKYETRFTAAESAVHQAKCNICKQNPILGFRFFLVITMIVMIMAMIVTVVKLGILSRNVEGPWFIVFLCYDHDHEDNDDHDGSFHQ